MTNIRAVQSMADLSPAQTGVEFRKEKSWPLLLLIVAVGAYLRFHMLGVRSLWPPECFSVLLAWQPWPMFLRTMWWGEANMAFYYTLLRGWALLGDSEAWLQGLSALFGVLTIPAVYALGKRFLGRKVGLFAAALLAVHSAHINHSEQMRCYSLWILLAVLSTYCFLALLESPHRKVLWLLYIFLAVLLIYTQVFGIFLLSAHWLAVIPRIKRLRIWKILAMIAAIGLLCLPMELVMLLRNRGQLGWIPPVSISGVWEVFRSIVGTDVLGPHDLATTLVLSILYVVTWILAVSGIFRAKHFQSSESAAKTAVVVLTWSLVFPFVVITAISFARPILYPRYLLMSLPAAVLLAGQGLSTIERSVARGRLASLAALLVMSALAFVGTHRFDSELKDSGNDFRGVSNYILEHKEPGDAVIFYNFSVSWAFDYYTRRFHETGGKGSSPPVLEPWPFERDSIERRTAPYRRVWVILQQTLPTPESIVNDEVLRQTMRQGRFHLAEETKFTGQSMFPNEDVSIDLALYSAAEPHNSP
jgi:mannosyltransferase